MREDADRIYFVPDTQLVRFLCKLSYRLPSVFGRVFVGPVIFVLSQSSMRKLAEELVRKHQINVVQQPIPVSPKTPSLMVDLKVPVVIGPLNGGMNYPEGFQYMEGRLGRRLVGIARTASQWTHRLFPGKTKAHTLLVANRRTRDALPRGIQGSVVELIENGVELHLWQSTDPRTSSTEQSKPVSFVFVGRLVDWKGVNFLLRAISIVTRTADVRLDVIGDGVERQGLETLSQQLGLQDVVRFQGWLPQPEIAKHLHESDIFILPSLWERGGAVVLEAMAAGVPVIATDWGGPADYIQNEITGILVPPTKPEQFPKDLAAAMVRLANNPVLRQRLAEAALVRVRSEYNWEKKIDRILEIYQEAITSCTDSRL